jgi:hypothetical protein
VASLVQKLLDAIYRADRLQLIERMNCSRNPDSMYPDLWWQFGIGEPPTKAIRKPAQASRQERVSNY